MDRNTLLDLIPAYTLGALDDEEREAVEALIEIDSEAKQVLADYQELSDLLVLMTPLEPAPMHLADDLRRRLAVEETTTAPPLAPQKDEPPIAAALPQPEKRPPLVWGLVALAAALAVIIGLVAVLQSMQPAAPSPQELYTQLAAQTNAVRVAVVPNEEAQYQFDGELVAAPNSTEAVIRINALPALPADQTYQLWLAEPETVISGGLFKGEGPDQPTYLRVPLTQPISYYRGLGVSLEPEGGSPFPNRSSGPNVFRVPLST